MSRRSRLRIAAASGATALLAVGLLAVSGAVAGPGSAGPDQDGKVSGGPEEELVTPEALGLPAVGDPEDNPASAAKLALGARLFFDPGLSADGTVSCASCHRPESYFADERALSNGVEGRPGERNAPSLLNVAYASNLLWDGRSVSLEDQVRYPVTHPSEMDMTPEGVEDYLAASDEYAALFKLAFDEDWVAWEQVCQALAVFERTLLTGGAPFDRWMAGDAEAIGSEARRGWELFRGEAGCIDCHHYEVERPFFTDFAFHNSGVGWNREEPDLGRYVITKKRPDKGAFRTPSLRNVAETAPYMHDGSFANLAAVIDHYAAGGEPNPLLDPKLRPLALSARDKADLVSFLKTLTGRVAYPRPALAHRLVAAEMAAKDGAEAGGAEESW